MLLRIRAAQPHLKKLIREVYIYTLIPLTAKTRTRMHECPGYSASMLLTYKESSFQYSVTKFQVQFALPNYLFDQSYYEPSTEKSLICSNPF